MSKHRAPGPAFRTLWEEQDSRAARALPVQDTRGAHREDGPARIPYYREPRSPGEFYDGTPSGMPL